MKAGKQLISVAVIRDLKSEFSVSMERYADQLQQMVLSDPGLELVKAALPEEDPRQVRGAIDKLRRYRRRYVEYPRTIKSLRADVYHIADHSYAYLLRNLPHERTVVTCHDVMLLTQGEWRQRAKWSPAVSLLKFSVAHLKEAAAVVAVSENTRRDLLKFNLVPPEKIAVIPPPVAPIFEAPHVRPEAGTGRLTPLQEDEFRNPACRFPWTL